MQDLSPQNNAPGNPPPCFIKFRVPEQEHFRILARAFEALKQEKHKLNEFFSDDDEKVDDEEQVSEQKMQPTNDSHERVLRKLSEVFFDLFDEHVLAHFWWPSEQEIQEYWQRWWATPVPQRWTDPALKDAWGFESMIDSFLNGEYELLSCRLLTSDTAVLEFLPFSFPYGGTGCMKALVEAFDFQVIGEDDGTGYVSYL